jgi:hypothetical protein
MQVALGIGIERTLKQADAVSAVDERTVCRYAEVTLRLAYSGHPAVTPAVVDPPLRGVLDVRLEWPERDEPPLAVRVVVHDEIARGAWREVATAIGDAVRAALLDRCPAHPHPHHTNHGYRE